MFKPFSNELQISLFCFVLFLIGLACTVVGTYFVRDTKPEGENNILESSLWSIIIASVGILSLLTSAFGYRQLMSNLIGDLKKQNDLIAIPLTRVETDDIIPKHRDSFLDNMIAQSSNRYLPSGVGERKGSLPGGSGALRRTEVVKATSSNVNTNQTRKRSDASSSAKKAEKEFLNLS